MCAFSSDCMAQCRSFYRFPVYHPFRICSVDHNDDPVLRVLLKVRTERRKRRNENGPCRWFFNKQKRKERDVLPMMHVVGRFVAVTSPHRFMVLSLDARGMERIVQQDHQDPYARRLANLLRSIGSTHCIYVLWDRGVMKWHRN